MHLFFYFNQAQFLGCKINYEDQLEDPIVVPCTSFIKKDSSNEAMFVFKIISKAHLVLFDSLSPRISIELKTHLQLSLDTRIGYWYLFENHTILRVYGFEEEPFLLPAFLTPNIYALEYIKKRFASDHEHFAKYHKTITFKLPYTIGPFSAKNRKARDITDDLLKNMKFQKGKKMHYDPYHVILEKREKIRISIYEHQADPELEKVANLESWEQVKKILINSRHVEKMELVISTPII